jgi:N-acetylmuramoyl-L-alanine amidase
VQANVVRLVLQTDRLPDLASIKPSSSFSFELELPQPPKQQIIEPPVDEEEKTSPPPVTIDNSTLIQPPVTPILQINLEKETDRTVSLNIPLPQKLTAPAQARKPEPEVLEIVLPGIAMLLPDEFKLESETIQEVTRSYDGTSTVLRFQFARPIAAQMWMEGSTVKITALKPTVSGTLMGKVIVVDPGHGGSDGGAKAGGVHEKDLNLIMGKLIAEKLTQEGATVIMTRKTDVFIPLTTRAKIANDNDADLFISSHINSTGGSGSQSGTITFHHLGQQISRLLAECIHREVSVVNGLPDIGVWSDGKIYSSGFSVLRNTKMPGVLLELGFINHPVDRARLVTKDFQEKVAAAVVKGIKVFLGDGR